MHGKSKADAAGFGQLRRHVRIHDPDDLAGGIYKRAAGSDISQVHAELQHFQGKAAIIKSRVHSGDHAAGDVNNAADGISDHRDGVAGGDRFPAESSRGQPLRVDFQNGKIRCEVQTDDIGFILLVSQRYLDAGSAGYDMGACDQSPVLGHDDHCTGPGPAARICCRELPNGRRTVGIELAKAQSAIPAGRGHMQRLPRPFIAFLLIRNGRRIRLQLLPARILQTQNWGCVPLPHQLDGKPVFIVMNGKRDLQNKRTESGSDYKKDQHPGQNPADGTMTLCLMGLRLFKGIIQPGGELINAVFRRSGICSCFLFQLLIVSHFSLQNCVQYKQNAARLCERGVKEM